MIIYLSQGNADDAEYADERRLIFSLCRQAKPFILCEPLRQSA